MGGGAFYNPIQIFYAAFGHTRSTHCPIYSRGTGTLHWRTLSYRLGNVNPDCHGLQEEEKIIGQTYNFGPLENITKEFEKINLWEQFKDFLTLICHIVGIYEFFKFMIFIIMTQYNAYDLGIVRALQVIWLMFILGDYQGIFGGNQIVWRQPCNGQHTPPSSPILPSTEKATHIWP